MKITKQARRDAKQLFRSCQANGLLDDNRVRQAVQAVVAKKPRGYVAILSQLHRLIKLDLARRSATIESATVLTPDQQGAVKANLAGKYGPGLNLSFAQKPELLGGLRIQVGSDVYDGSVRARLQQFGEAL